MRTATNPVVSVFPGHDTVGVEPGGRADPPAPASGAIRMLRLLLLGTIVVPLGLAAVGGYLSYRAYVARAEQALVEAVAVAEENTVKVLDTHELVAARIDDLLAGLSDAEIGTQEQTLHERLARQIKDLPQVAAAWALDANGHELVSARVYPVNRDLDHSGRDDFRALQGSHLQNFIWALRARSLGEDVYRPYFTVAGRREDTDGKFRGISIVAVSGTYFASFYNSLLGNPGDYAAGIFREDAVSLARYPEEAKDAAPLQRDDPLAQAIASKSSDGIIVTGSPLDRNGRLVAYRRVANYPVYVTISRTERSILQEWLGAMRGYVAIGAAAAIALALLSLIALRRTRSEQAALARARDAIAQRAAVENQLHQTQKLEAIGQLSAGIAHDFNNLITVIVGNVALLQQRIKSDQPNLQRPISEAIAGCERASKLTKRLLSFSRYQTLDPQPTDANAVIASMSDLLARSLGDRVVCQTVLADSLWFAFVDPNQLENSLLNLAVNARDAMREPGSLTITTANRALDEAYAASRAGATAGDYIEISVSDTGSGMADEVRQRAFDPFFTTKQPGKGTGLGLSQVYGFVHAAGGHCVIESAPGHGTTVRLYLPRYIGGLAGADMEVASRAEPSENLALSSLSH
jgi:two-component system NtrC family sensor kinase